MSQFKKMIGDGEKTRAIFQFIVDYKQEHDGCSPSFREIQKAVGFGGAATLKRHLDWLVENYFLVEPEDGYFGQRSLETVDGSWSYKNGRYP